MSFPSSLDYPQSSFIKPSHAGYRSGRTGSTSSSSSTSSSTSFSEPHAYDKVGMMQPPPSLNTLGRPPSRGSPPITARGRPAPINTAKANETSITASAPSPRAALVAGLRSATDRRHQQREQQIRDQHLLQQQLLLQQQHLQQQKQLQLQQQQQQQILLQQQQLRMQNLSLADSGGQGQGQGQGQPYLPPFQSALDAHTYHLSPPTSPIPSSSSHSSTSSLPFNYNERADPRVFAQLQQRHQDLLASTAFLAQQQQQYMAALGSSNNGGEFEFPLASPVSYAGSPMASYVPQQHYARNSVYNTDLPNPSTRGGYQRPSSPNLPVRPSSSSSFRGMNQSSSSHTPSAYQLPSSSSSSASSFRRSHRKAASLSGSGDPFILNNSYSNFSHQSSGSLGAIGSGLNSSLRKTTTPSSFSNGGSSALAYTRGGGLGHGGGRAAGAASDVEIPVRQPIGPPPLDELKTLKRGSNFAKSAAMA